MDARQRSSAIPAPARGFFPPALAVAALALPVLPACTGGENATPEGIISLSAGADQTSAENDPATLPRADGPRIGAVQMVAPIYEKADRRSAKLGYLRAGGTAPRGEKPVSFDDCQGGYYRVLPAGYMCADSDATIDMQHPILRALTRRPDLSKPMPYPYAFVRAIAPNYYRMPAMKEQLQYEMSLERHLRSYKKLKKKWDEVKIGANDVPLDAQGNATGDPSAEPPELGDSELFGGNGSDEIPWFFKGGRQLPNISSFKVPGYAIITNRIARKGGLALIDTFMGDGGRRFAMTTDARLVPTSKLKPARGSTFHGVDMTKGWELPLAFVHRQKAKRYDISGGQMEKAGELPWHTAVQLTGRSRKVGGARLVEAKDGTWVRDSDVAIAVKPSELPSFAQGDVKWIDISILSQTLILYEGKRPVYATAAATGRDGLGDPRKTFSTVRGTFRIRDKHVTTTMDAHEVDNKFELRDVPWVQYFEAGYAIHAAPWHDDYGNPRSHGCINLSPVDARRVFLWTDPPVPDGWHGASAARATGEGTIVHIHP
ncbi:L,D-transpeptidase [Sorangium sp. So ce887]|uniref:L,D-transpeptidase n=1 Tax=Sorangium sp. So ce887 TaxID=3133324 RepID=UPI003F64833B